MVIKEEKHQNNTRAKEEHAKAIAFIVKSLTKNHNTNMAKTSSSLDKLT